MDEPVEPHDDVIFDDAKANLDMITKALGEAGYTVGEPVKL